MHKTKIEYAEFSWNPIRGLCPVGCPYCYARRIYNRFHYSIATGIYLDEKELGAPLKRKKPARIFACTTIEPFWWSDQAPIKDWTLDYLFPIMSECPKLTFLLLTKIPGNIKHYDQVPRNVWLGTTITRQSEVSRAAWLKTTKGAAVKWISFEPLLEPIWDIDLKGIDWVVMGRLTGGRGTGPAKPRWFRELMEICATANVPFFLKNNLSVFWGPDFLAGRVSFPKCFYEPRLPGGAE